EREISDKIKKMHESRESQIKQAREWWSEGMKKKWSAMDFEKEAPQVLAGFARPGKVQPIQCSPRDIHYKIVGKWQKEIHMIESPF
ncbi:hypothetical protein, partial [Klebsiella variicola]|uniref:hypothetical protein n=1 Tax=Klebsiella variicola TaxID=244366 RepID=UPI0034DDF0A3